MRSFAQIMVKVLIGLIAAYFLGTSFLFFIPLFEVKPIYLIAFPAISILTVLLLKSPASLVAVILFSRALLDTTLSQSRLSFFGFNTGLGGLINFLVIFLGVLFVIKNKESFRKFPFAKPWAIFLILSGLSISYTPVKPDALKLWVSLLTYPVMFYLPYCLIKSDRDRRHWLNVLLGATIATCAFTCFKLITTGSAFSGILADGRISGSFPHPNILAFFILFSMVLVFYLLKTDHFSKSPIAKRGLGIYLLALFMLFFATKTRSAWFACWVFFATYGLLRERRYLFFALVLPPLLLLVPAIQDRVMDLFSHNEGDLQSGLNSWAWRRELWKNSLEEIKNHFVIGQGLSSFAVISVKFMGAAAEKSVPSHNTFLQVMFETGFVGLCAFLAIFVRVIQVILKGTRSIFSLSFTRVIAFLFITGYAITCFGDNLLYYLAYNWYFWFFLGLLTQSIQVDQESRKFHAVIASPPEGARRSYA